ncbi:helix-turn-helix domain-containing protein [Halomonas aquatica]|uniref:Helix-turn-helix domain-containing protein n=1 Tax=Halomonas aquatica TaxID=3151123 RepID=A0ABV1NDB7_9GAMM
MDITRTDATSQCLRILARLREGPATTSELMLELNVLRPGARISELREKGHDIRTHLIDEFDPWGRPHSRMAHYYLPTSPVEGADDV